MKRVNKEKIYKARVQEQIKSKPGESQGRREQEKKRKEAEYITITKKSEMHFEDFV